MKKNIRTREEIINEIIQYFEDNVGVFNDAIVELDSWNGYLGDDRFYEMEMLRDFYYNVDVFEILNRVYYGHDLDSFTTDSYGNITYEEFNPNRDFFGYNGYGNLISTNYPDYSSHLDKYAIEKMLEEMENIYTIQDNSELLTLFNELLNVSEEAIENEK